MYTFEKEKMCKRFPYIAQTFINMFEKQEIYDNI